MMDIFGKAVLGLGRTWMEQVVISDLEDGAFV